MIATLLGDPFWLSIEQVFQLTDRQIHDLYFRPRDKDGKVIPQQDESDSNPEVSLAMLLAAGAISREDYAKTIGGIHGR
jgi:hypothetical protein